MNTSADAAAHRRRHHASEAASSEAPRLRPDLMMRRKSQQRIDLDCSLHIEEDVNQLQKQAMIADDHDRHHEELWSLRSWTQDNAIFPHPVEDGQWWRWWAGSLCRELGQLGRDSKHSPNEAISC